MFKQLDIVRIKTTKRISWVSKPDSMDLKTMNPNGDWSVAGVVGSDLIICRSPVTVRIPCEDVLKIADYNIFKENKDGKE
jgi:hypothetical protein